MKWEVTRERGVGVRAGGECAREVGDCLRESFLGEMGEVVWRGRGRRKGRRRRAWEAAEYILGKAVGLIQARRRGCQIIEATCS